MGQEIRIGFLVTKTIDETGIKLDTIVGLSITSPHPYALPGLWKAVDMTQLVPGMKIMSAINTPRLLNQLPDDKCGFVQEMVVKWPNMPLGNYLIQRRVDFERSIDFEAVMANLKRVLSIPGLAPGIIFRFVAPIVIKRACYFDLDDFLNNNMRPAIQYNLT